MPDLVVDALPLPPLAPPRTAGLRAPVVRCGRPRITGRLAEPRGAWLRLEVVRVAGPVLRAATPGSQSESESLPSSCRRIFRRLPLSTARQEDVRGRFP